MVPGYYPDAPLIVRTVGDILQLDSGHVQNIVAKLDAQRKELPIDVPDPFFKGPF
jgi:hypothetical protein